MSLFVRGTVPCPLGARIFLVSALVLFLEILFIRWLSAEVPVFLYLRNLVLLVAFAGLGAGCLASRRPAWPAFSALSILGLVLLVLDPLGLELVPLKLADQTLLFIGRERPSAGQVAYAAFATVLCCGLLAGLFFPLGQLTGRWMEEHPRPIAAYSWNGLGGLAGLWFFQALSQLWLPPVAWFALAIPPLLGVTRGNRQRLGVAACMVLVLLTVAFSPRLVAVLKDGQEEGDRVEEYVEATPDYRVLWSPYHKIGVRPRTFLATPDAEPVELGYQIRLADIKFQRIVNLAPEHVQAHPEFYNPASVARNDYDLPYRFGLPPLDSVLVAGAGAGNDVAAALRAGARRVVAVEIDPAFLELGRQLHPEKPYDDPRVEVVLDDARAFFRRCRERFDLVVLAHLSSMPRGSELQQMSYFYTRESFREARRLVKPGRGYLVCSVNWDRLAYVRLRIRTMLTLAFGTPPLLYENPDLEDHIGNPGLCYVEAEPEFLKELASRRPPDEDRNFERVNPEIAALVPTDDWPFLFVRQTSSPESTGGFSGPSG